MTLSLDALITVTSLDVTEEFIFLHTISRRIKYVVAVKGDEQGKCRTNVIRLDGK